MNQITHTRLGTASVVIVVGFVVAMAQAATVYSPQQIIVNDMYQLNPDYASGDEATTCPKIDLNDGAGGDNPYFQRFNVARAHLGGCSERYWYTSSYQMTCDGDPPVNTCGDGPCIDEPDPSDTQYVDYAPPFGSGTNELSPGRYRIVGEYRFTDARATYPAEYIVNHAGGTTTVNQSQREGTLNSCPSFEIGTFDMDTGSYVRVNDTGSSSITFNRMRFTLVAGLGGVPLVYAGKDRAIILPNTAPLNGQAGPEGVTTTWSKVSGPGTVTFGNPSELSTTAEFSEQGVYVLRLTADDGVNPEVYDDITITVYPEDAMAGMLVPTNDTYVDQTAGSTNRDDDGLVIKGQSGWQRRGIIEFNLPNLPVAEAKLNLLHVRSWSFRVWRLYVAGKQASFADYGHDETTVTWNNAGGITDGGEAITDFQMAGGTPVDQGGSDGKDVVPPQWREVDITDFFNANRGKTVLFILTNYNAQNQEERGGVVEDREGSRSGDPMNAPYITFELTCNTPFADADGDGDVDQDDFALFQRCYTGPHETIDPDGDLYCACFDRDGDESIDIWDLFEFQKCATGPAVQWSQELTPDCTP